MATTVTKGKYASIETLVYGYLRNELHFNVAIACGILANIDEESRFNPTAVGDSGAAYGLCQWNSRKSELIKYCERSGLDYKTAVGQMAFLNHELHTTESKAMNEIKNIQNTAQGAYDAGERFCIHFERPSNKESKGKARGELARDIYWKHYSDSGNDAEARVEALNLGQRIVIAAREQLDKPWSSGGIGPDSFDDLGLVRYCYNQVGITIPDYDKEVAIQRYLLSTAKIVSPASRAAAGDIILFSEYIISSGYSRYYLAISNGTGGCITIGDITSLTATSEDIVTEYASIPSTDGVSIGVYRLVSDAQTSQGPIPNQDNPRSPDYWSLASNDPYASLVAANLSRVQAEGFKEGYLIDMTHGGVFRFYVPEFEESAGANWDTINIIGRSVSVLSYNSTSSRKIQVSLDLYAGIGMYDVTNPVDRLHADANFLKSLEYPDYTNAIARPPATVHLILGSAVNLVGVVSGVTVNHLKPLDSQNRAMYLKVSFTVTQTAVNPPDYIDVYNGQYAIAGTDNISSLLSGGIPDENTNAPVFNDTYMRDFTG